MKANRSGVHKRHCVYYLGEKKRAKPDSNIYLINRDLMNNDPKDCKVEKTETHTNTSTTAVTADSGSKIVEA